MLTSKADFAASPSVYMLQRALRECCARCSTAAAPRLGKPWWHISETARPWPRSAHLHAQRQTVCTAASPATSRHAETCADAAGSAAPGSCFAARQDASLAAAQGVNRRPSSGADSRVQQAASVESHSSSDADSSEPSSSSRLSSSGWPKQPKKVIPWPTPIRAGEPLPADPMTWQNAAVLVDKPLDWTSFDVCGKLRGALRIKKVGHAGTLDPQATGLLIICIGKGCKKVDMFVAMDKVYTGTLRLGEATPSFDAETEVSERRPWQHLSDADLAAARDGFLGDIMQLPPMYSAIRIKGQRLYMAARAGETVQREPRAVSVSQFELWRDAPDAQDVHFRIACSKGTYIRALVHDLGKAVGSAAHMVALRRESVGTHSVCDAWQLPELVAAIREQRAALGLSEGAPMS